MPFAPRTLGRQHRGRVPSCPGRPLLPVSAVSTRRNWLVALAPLALIPLWTACSPGTSSDAAVADAYSEVIKWFADRSPDDPDPLTVFVEARGEGFEIELLAQAAVVEASAPFADVEFIDDRSEAIGDDGVVRDEGLLLAFGPAVLEAELAIIECDEIITMESMHSWRFELRYVGDGWLVLEDAIEVSP